MLQRMLLFVLLGSLALPGCTPRVKVKKDPWPWNHGVRYYRPKPYLLVSPAGQSVSEDDGKKVTVNPSDRFVSIQLQYLPDFSEEYSISVKTGLGKAVVGIELEDGWNLTKISQDLDSQFDENVKAIGDLIGSVGGVFSPTAGGETRGNGELVVSASNVPLGYYESVIARDPDGKKQLYGWRYVGFAPFNSCPTRMAGGDAACCDDGNGPIYGLVFERGAMVFRPLGEIGLRTADPVCYETLDPPVAGKRKSASFNPEELPKRIESAIAELIQEQTGRDDITIQAMLLRNPERVAVRITAAMLTAEERNLITCAINNSSSIAGLLAEFHLGGTQVELHFPQQEEIEPPEPR